ncbi:hypothetical protein AXG93_4542s1000 [Marchantia polymorpha subsp. ruderalis]|uniref:Uncharacterized protein n=1 Tax=Marchantia polymorpha subsp. ruderalis TaxID=1480154 RepID=A0A176W0K0_MARPO|nr:hypothetical protein AXG93_4542s1000 [Marchantia polymorpha subsp. ruderalis]
MVRISIPELGSLSGFQDTPERKIRRSQGNRVKEQDKHPALTPVPQSRTTSSHLSCVSSRRVSSVARQKERRITPASQPAGRPEEPGQARPGARGAEGQTGQTGQPASESASRPRGRVPAPGPKGWVGCQSPAVAVPIRGDADPRQESGRRFAQASKVACPKARRTR